MSFGQSREEKVGPSICQLVTSSAADSGSSQTGEDAKQESERQAGELRPVELNQSPARPAGLHQRAEQERPRERMMIYGPEALGDVEILALLIGGGHAIPRATEVLNAVGGIGGLARACPHELLGVHGIGEAAATSLAAAVELGRRIQKNELPWAASLKNPSEAAEFVRSLFRGATQEKFLCIGLDTRHRVRLVRFVAVGSLSHVEVHPREVFRPLVRAGMHACLLVHNHPSGDTKPSMSDVEITRRLMDVGATVGIPVLDHIIVTESEFVSMAECGLLE